MPAYCRITKKTRKRAYKYIKTVTRVFSRIIWDHNWEFVETKDKTCLVNRTYWEERRTLCLYP